MTQIWCVGIYRVLLIIIWRVMRGLSHPDYHYLGYVAIGRVLTVGNFRGHHYGRWSKSPLCNTTPSGILSPLKLRYIFIKRSVLYTRWLLPWRWHWACQYDMGSQTWCITVLIIGCIWSQIAIARTADAWTSRWTSDIGRRDIGAASRKAISAKRSMSALCVSKHDLPPL